MTTPKHIILLAGSSACTDRSLITGALAVLCDLHPGAVLYTGDAPGAEDLAVRAWAWKNTETVPAACASGLIVRFKADWDRPCDPAMCEPGHRRARPDGTDYCPAGSAARNERMCGRAAGTGLPVTTLAVFKQGEKNYGTRDCVAAMARHGLPGPLMLMEGRTR